MSSKKNPDNDAMAAKRAAITHKVIDSIDDAPKGEVLSAVGGQFAMNEAWRKEYGVMRSGEHVLLLCTIEGFGGPRMFELNGRIQQAGIRTPRVVTLTSDVLALIYRQAESRAQTQVMSTTSVEKLADEIVRSAARQGASDIHIEAGREYAKVFYRIDGIRRFVRDLTHINALSLGAVLYNVYADPGSKEVAWSPTEIMDGGVEWDDASTGKRYQLRFSSGPIYPSQSFHIVIRLLLMDAKNGASFDGLGYSDEQRALIENMATGSSGMVILCGPTNSGKSTSLRAMIAQLYEERGDAIKIITVEDPVEYVIPGACQVPVGRRGRRSDAREAQEDRIFADFLRGALRQDPDVVMAGEIRDKSSASVVKDIVLAGRKLFTTVHASSALWSYMRLHAMGVPWDVLTMPGFISGIVYQRLVPALCPHCAIKLGAGGRQRLSRSVLRRLKAVATETEMEQIKVRGDGCEHCEFTGYEGRTVCAEVLVPDRQMLKFLSDGDRLAAEAHWHGLNTGASDGQVGITALDHAIFKMKAGLISPLDVEHHVAPLSIDAIDKERDK